MNWFVRRDSIVRKIWGKPDTVLFVFAGASAEFALNKAVDWLFFTGKLPADPLGRLFSTVTYARKIVFSELEEANTVIDRMAGIHTAVEQSRGASIPAWAYRDVLYMLIDYSMRSHSLLERPLNDAEREEVFDVFRRVGLRMGIPDLPTSFPEWERDRELHLIRNLEPSELTRKLYAQYRYHLGFSRYQILRAAQGIIVPVHVRQMLDLRNSPITRGFVRLYKKLVQINAAWIVKMLILPPKYSSQVRKLEVA